MWPNPQEYAEEIYGRYRYGKFNVLCSDIIGDPDTQIINIYLKF